MIKPPCYDCSRRKPACHDGCEDYAKWAKQRKAAAEKRQQDETVLNYKWDSYNRQMRRYKRWKDG